MTYLQCFTTVLLVLLCSAKSSGLAQSLNADQNDNHHGLMLNPRVLTEKSTVAPLTTVTGTPSPENMRPVLTANTDFVKVNEKFILNCNINKFNVSQYDSYTVDFYFSPLVKYPVMAREFASYKVDGKDWVEDTLISELEIALLTRQVT